MAGNTLRANDIALQVIGQNIANANTPGYVREEAVMKAAATQKLGGLLFGMGVQVEAIVQKVDKFLQERLRNAYVENADAQTLQDTYVQLEQLVGALDDNSLSTSLNNFFSSISDILNQPQDVSVRNLSVLQGQSLADNISNLAGQVEALRDSINDRIESMADDINRLTSTIADLNVRIASAEGSAVSKSVAGGLRDQRNAALQELATLIGTHNREQPNGSVTVYCGQDYLVSDGISREVEAVLNSSDGTPKTEILFAATSSKLDSTSGELGGLYASRDQVAQGFLDQLNNFTGALVFEFNKIFSSGQGLSGFSSLTSANSADDSSVSLADAGLPFTPQDGSFQVLVRNKSTALTSTTDVTVDLDGKGRDTTLDDLATALNNIDGISAQITYDGKLEIISDSGDSEFSFANDTSGTLAALGLNIFFTGSTVDNIGVSTELKADPGKFAASDNGIGAGTDNALLLANFRDQSLDSQNGQSLDMLYQNLVSSTAQNSANAQSAADAAQAFQSTIEGQNLAVSGVNLDEEAVQMIAYQRAYQASAKFIGVVSQLFEILVQL
ncbi:MAG: flagellar hook-associated protein FlgK [Thermoguttaceae bacterium]